MPKAPRRIELRKFSDKARLLTTAERKADKAFYKSPRWLAVRTVVLRRDAGLCQECKRNGKLSTGSQVDHIKPRKQFPELAYDIDNLETLDIACHNAKRKKERLGS